MYVFFLTFQSALLFCVNENVINIGMAQTLNFASRELRQWSTLATAIWLSQLSYYTVPGQAGI